MKITASFLRWTLLIRFRYLRPILTAYFAVVNLFPFARNLSRSDFAQFGAEAPAKSCVMYWYVLFIGLESGRRFFADYTLKLAQFLRPYVRKNHTISYYKDASFLVFNFCTDTCLKVTFVQCLTTARYRIFLGHFSITQQRGELPVTQTECWTSQLGKPTMNCKSSEFTVEYVV